MPTTHPFQLSQKHPCKRAFITGAGSGLGLAFAAQLARHGWTVAITDVNEERLVAAAKIVEQAGGTATSYIFDVANYEKFQEAVTDFAEKNGGIDIGINNAGVGCGGYLHELPIETFRRVVEINLMGTVNGCHLFLPIMKKQRSGHILNVASAAAFVTAPRMSPYNTSKAGVVALSETLRSELLHDGIVVSVLMPTYIRTNIGKDCLGSAKDNRYAQMLVDQSDLNPDQVVSETFAKMETGELYVVLPGKARFLWSFKRFLPNRFWRFIDQEATRRFAMLDRQS